MRRSSPRPALIGPALTGFGFFAVAAAVTLLVVGRSLITIPAAETLTQTVRGTGLTVFSGAEQTQRGDVTVVGRQVTTGDPDAPGAGPHVAVQTSGTVLRESGGALVAANEFTFCMDRTTGAATSPCPAARADTGVRDGFTGQVTRFPFGTQARDHDLFDPVTGRAWPALYDDTDFVDGLGTVRFVQQVPETVVGTQEVPGELAGGARGTGVRTDVVYSATRTVWVEPTSGIVVRSVEEPLRYLRTPEGKPLVVLLFGSVGTDGETIAANVDRAEQDRSRIVLLRSIAPLGLGLLGLVALTAGLAVLWRSRAAGPPAPRHRVAVAAAPVGGP